MHPKDKKRVLVEVSSRVKKRMLAQARAWASPQFSTFDRDRARPHTVFHENICPFEP
jgi:hypothetical protein